MKRHLATTGDGSLTIFVPQLDEHYHSIHGAVQESRHVFIRAGLQKLRPEGSNSKLRILEVGMGTGLNVLLTAVESHSRPMVIHYTAVEKYPLQSEEWQALPYGELVTDGGLIYESIHSSPWEAESPLSEHFQLHKIQGDIGSLDLPHHAFDLVYYDAFAPSAQPELWTETVFSLIYQSMAPEGILVTYCVKGSVRRALQAAGFRVEKIPGPPGKREMTRAYKKDAHEV